MAILIVQHSDTCRSGRLGVTLRDHAFALDVVRPDRGEVLPDNLDEIDGIVSLGGPQSANNDLPWIDQECALLHAAHDAKLPVVGICLGAQLLAKALGGEVGRAQVPETGFFEMNIVGPGQTDPVFAGVTWQSQQFGFHADEVTALPDGAQVLATSRDCAAQVFKIGMRTYGIQYHLEADRPMIDDIVADGCPPAPTPDSATIDAQAEAHYAEFARLADRVCVNIVTCLIPRVATMARV